MKKIIYISIVSCISIFVSCEDKLDTAPSGMSQRSEIFSTVEKSFSALNGVYRSFYMADEDLWSTSYSTENFGQSSVNLAADLMGEDMAFYAPGSYWFIYDYVYDVKSYNTNTSDRPYTWWNMYYKWVSAANDIITYVPDAIGDEADKNNLLAQAYALRAYSYFYLAQFYQRTYMGNEDAPGVPIYTTATTKESVGKGRGTLEQVFLRINDDLDEALRLFEQASPQKHISHIDKYVTYGIKARVALVQNNWVEAEKAAEEALKKPGLELMSTGDILAGFNDVANKEWMWASDVRADHSTTWFSFFSHMDASAGYHATTAQKCISKWLYDKINENDIRKSWFNGATQISDLPQDVPYCQWKFRDPSTSLEGDLLYMRAAEMYLILAEAKCRIGVDYEGARSALKTVVAYKMPDYDYDAYLGTLQESDVLNLTTSVYPSDTQTLMDEIIFQRRLELWGEGFRILDIMRLKTGFVRDYEDNNHLVAFDIVDPDSWDWIMLIPQKEFDGNPNMDAVRDQNE